MKRTISTFQYDILKKELTYLEEVGGLNPNQADNLLSYYEVGDAYSPKNKNSSWNLVTPQNVKESDKKSGISLNFIQIISIIGAVLIGLGVLSFVASNWSQLSDMEKFFLLLSGLIVSYVSAWWTEEKRPITSKALYYIGAFMYGAEIFYIGQMFHLGGELSNALIAWSIGVIPLAIYKKDRILYACAFGLLYLSIELEFMMIDGGVPSYWMFGILPLLFVTNRYLRFLNPYLQLANFVLLYQFVEMKFLFFDEISFGWAIPMIIGLFLLSEFVFKKEKRYLYVANFILLYQFIQMKIAVESFDNASYLIAFVLIVPALFVVGHKVMKKSISLFTANIVMGIQFLLLFMHYLEINKVCWYFAVLFLIGMVFTHKQHSDYRMIMKWIGIILQFTAGIILTVEPVYEEMTAIPIWTLFGLLYVLYGLYLAYKNQLFGILIVSVLIFRFYVDVSMAFMNKSIAFLVGGILLLGLGYWFEKTRRREKRYEEKTTAK